ncbi:unnamed protein product [Prunus armeniaca]
MEDTKTPTQITKNPPSSSISSTQMVKDPSSSNPPTQNTVELGTSLQLDSVPPWPELVAFCERMDAMGLRKYMNETLDNRNTIWAELLGAIRYPKVCGNEGEEIEGGDGKPVAYYSEMFSGPILNYTTNDKELYAMHQAVKHWRAYLLGKEIVVHSDHKPLQFLTTQSKLQKARHLKWMSYLQQFNIVIKYKKGATNKLADMLSRPPILVSSALLVAMQIQPIIPSKYAKWYDTYVDFNSAYVELQQGKTSEFQLKDGLMYKGTQLCIPEDKDRLQLIREAHTSKVA